MRIKWERLATGDFLGWIDDMPVVIGRFGGGRDMPVRVDTPCEHDPNFDDGWLWHTVWNPVTHSVAEFGNLPDAKRWVADNIDVIRGYFPSEKYDGDVVAKHQAQKDRSDDWARRAGFSKEKP